MTQRQRPERVPKLWPESTVVCVGGGPSLTPDDVAWCQGKARVLVVNDGYRLAPWADGLVAYDDIWWSWHQGVPSFHGLKYACQPRARRWPGVDVLRDTGNTGLDLDPTAIRTGRNSGYAAINIAVHMGARRIVLLGYDMQGKPGREHWFGRHPVHKPQQFTRWRDRIATLDPALARLGIAIVNCSRDTALKVFPRAPLADVLPAADLEACA